MPLPFFYCIQLREKESFELDVDTARHVTQVLRLKEGDQIGITNGKGLYAECTIIAATKKQCLVKAGTIQTTPAPAKKITIAIGLLKNKTRMEWFLEKATELGVTSFVPLITARTERQNFRIDRMEAILVSAMLQSQQHFLPILQEPIAFTKFITSDYKQKLIAHCESDAEKKSISDFTIEEEVCMLIGPEGDFTQDEISLAKQHGYQPVSLGNTRLRTETAGISAAVHLTI